MVYKLVDMFATTLRGGIATTTLLRWFWRVSNWSDTTVLIGLMGTVSNKLISGSTLVVYVSGIPIDRDAMPSIAIRHRKFQSVMKSHPKSKFSADPIGISIGNFDRSVFPAKSDLDVGARKSKAPLFVWGWGCVDKYPKPKFDIDIGISYQVPNIAHENWQKI